MGQLTIPTDTASNPLNAKAFLNRSQLHREGMSSALVMIMSQNGPLQWAGLHWTLQNSLGEGLEQWSIVAQGLATNGHRNILAIEENAVFIEVGIGNIESPSRDRPYPGG